MSWSTWLAGVAVDEPAEGAGQVGLRIDRVELAGLDQRGDDAPVDAALIAAGECPGRAASSLRCPARRQRQRVD